MYVQCNTCVMKIKDIIFKLEVKEITQHKLLSVSGCGSYGVFALLLQSVKMCLLQILCCVKEPKRALLGREFDLSSLP